MVAAWGLEVFLCVHSHTCLPRWVAQRATWACRCGGLMLPLQVPAPLAVAAGCWVFLWTPTRRLLCQAQVKLCRCRWCKWCDLKDMRGRWHMAVDSRHCTPGHVGLLSCILRSVDSP
jgi:hypothetical protein